MSPMVGMEACFAALAGMANIAAARAGVTSMRMAIVAEDFIGPPGDETLPSPDAAKERQPQVRRTFVADSFGLKLRTAYGRSARCRGCREPESEKMASIEPC